MQNKGFVKVIAVLFAFICLFYLSFSIVSSYYSNKAAKMFGEGTEEYQAYLDSMSRDTVWLGHTLKECRENELSLGLDLKGGMNVVMEVSVADILKSLAGTQSMSEPFVNAINSAKKKQLTNQRDFVDLFAESFKEENPGVPLTTIFATFDLKEKISNLSTDEEVVSVLKNEVEAAVDNSFNVLRSRIDRFGVVQPNIQRLDLAGRILIEMPGIKEPERVRKLLQGSADLEFWETFELSEIINSIDAVNQMARDMAHLSDKESNDTTTVAAKTDSVAAPVNSLDSLLAKAVADSTDRARAMKENPLYAVLELAIDRKSNQIIPGATIGFVHKKDTAKVAEYFRLAKQKRIVPQGLTPRWSVTPDKNREDMFELFAINCKRKDAKAPLAGSVIVDAKDDFEQFSSKAKVSMEMNQEGAATWARLTKENIGRCVAVVLDGYVYSCPRVNQEITGGRSEITGNFTPQEAKDLANVLKSGKMPAPAHIVQEDVVGPSLGQEAIHAGLISFIIAFCAILIYMIFYYGLVPGLVADFALLCNVFLIFGVLASFKAVLTLPGIAGIVLTLGMAVDANVLIYERIREELKNGKQIKRALADGYRNAFSAIIDSNVTTVLTGIILFMFGTGPIKGFATTLIIGVLCSFFTAIFISRLIFEWLLGKSDKFNKLQFTTELTKNWFQNMNVDFMGKRKVFYIVSSCVILIGLVSLFTNGMNKGIDFSGGRNYIVRFENPVSTVDVRKMLEPSFDNNSSLSVITIGDNNQVRISTNYRINDNDNNVDEEIESLIYNALKPIMNPAVTRDMFVNRYALDNGSVRASDNNDEATFGLQSSQKVGPTMADDIKTSAIWAVLISLIIIGLYIFIRFRNIAFSVGAIASLTHDTLIIFGLFSILKDIMPFSMEIDQSFIAAILTVIGYSINDNVVIFDRIRENLGLYPNRDIRSVVNTSLNSTLSRTFSTSMSTFVVLIVIFLLGGDTIRGFIFAMLIGVIVGTYSSWFVATPLAYDLLKKDGGKSLMKKKEEPAAEAADGALVQA
ncbi:MAG: protein translocase subunit SecDF [Paludibacteraceae bacterium]|nr:protein translocase subunit SecDF [Paludibacteraceae bacterium]